MVEDPRMVEMNNSGEGKKLRYGSFWKNTVYHVMFNMNKRYLSILEFYDALGPSDLLSRKKILKPKHSMKNY